MPETPAAATTAHWAHLEQNTLTRRWRSICRTRAPECGWRSPWFSGSDAATRATEDGLAHAQTAR